MHCLPYSIDSTDQRHTQALEKGGYMSLRGVVVIEWLLAASGGRGVGGGCAPSHTKRSVKLIFINNIICILLYSYSQYIEFHTVMYMYIIYQYK